MSVGKIRKQMLTLLTSALLQVFLFMMMPEIYSNTVVEYVQYTRSGKGMSSVGGIYCVQPPPKSRENMDKPMFSVMKSEGKHLMITLPTEEKAAEYFIITIQCSSAELSWLSR